MANSDLKTIEALSVIKIKKIDGIILNAQFSNFIANDSLKKDKLNKSFNLADRFVQQQMLETIIPLFGGNILNSTANNIEVISDDEVITEESTEKEVLKDIELTAQILTDVVDKFIKNNNLAGNTYDLSNQDDVKKAVKDICLALGGNIVE